MFEATSIHLLAVYAAGLVAALRQKVPAVDGWRVPVALLFVAAVLCSPASVDHVLVAAQRTGLVWLEAFTGVSLLGYVASKAAPKVADNADTVAVEHVDKIEVKT